MFIFILGSSSNEEDVANVCKDVDIVASCLGNVKGSDGKYLMIMQNSAENVLKANPPKVIFVTTLGVNGTSGLGIYYLLF